MPPESPPALSDFSLNLSQSFTDLVNSMTAGTQAEAGAAALAGTTLIADAAVLGGVLTGGLAAVLILAGAAGFFYLADEHQTDFMLFPASRARYGRPWIAGLEGYQLGNLHAYYQNEYHKVRELRHHAHDRKFPPAFQHRCRYFHQLIPAIPILLTECGYIYA